MVLHYNELTLRKQLSKKNEWTFSSLTNQMINAAVNLSSTKMYNLVPLQMKGRVLCAVVLESPIVLLASCG